MTYRAHDNLNPVMQRERELLTRGFSYAEVASETGARLATIKERNRLVYGIDLQAAFGARVQRDGIPGRYSAGDSFGWWFAGYFDGEGCLTIFYRDYRGRPERRVGVQLSCREDDADVLRHVHSMLGVGILWKTPAKGTTRPALNWRVERATDLAQVILPVFDNYPLRSKKKLEYDIWRPLVVKQYIQTLGGTSARVGASEEENATFKLDIQRIREIRHPR